MCRAPLKISLLSGLPVEILQLQLQLQYNLPCFQVICGSTVVVNFQRSHNPDKKLESFFTF